LTLCGLDLLKVLPDVLSQHDGQVDIFHSSICQVNNCLVVSILSVKLGEEHGQLSENLSIYDGADQVNNHDVDQLHPVGGAQLVTTEYQNAIVNTN
jgi:hypothetical protein